jgi:hypothetical protein
MDGTNMYLNMRKKMKNKTLCALLVAGALLFGGCEERPKPDCEGMTTYETYDSPQLRGIYLPKECIEPINFRSTETVFCKTKDGNYAYYYMGDQNRKIGWYKLFVYKKQEEQK